mmetsp:Transcript_1880/g.8334  ORF Transcript_1880/g.8334 Transcript_1880/m.8334 type:complete len:320 (+) Transcript_1880:153-1112(+)
MGGDALDHSVAFLKQRDGLDKTLKLMRYVSAIAAYNILADDPSSVTGTKLRKLDKSTGITRKYLKLGKFLGNLKELRALLRAGEMASRQRIAPAGNRTPDAALASAAAFANRLNIASQLAQLVYNFAEQLNWAAKIGLIRDARRRRKIERWTSVAELATYVFTINVSMLTLWRCAQRETRARREYHSRGLRKKDDDADDAAAMVPSPLRLLRGLGLGGNNRRDEREDSAGSDASVNTSESTAAGHGAIRTERDLTHALEVIDKERTSAVLALVADCADVAVCIGDVRGVRALTAPGTVNALGLVSASCGVVDKWRATKV